MAIKSKLVGLGKEGGEFVVIELTAAGPVPVYSHDGQLLRFSDGGAAARHAQSITTAGRKFQPRRVKDDTWHVRENGRFADKQYQHLPWHGAVWWRNHEHIWGPHYPHVSQKNSVGLMAYTESDDKGSADIQTAVKPGRYLEKYFGDVLDPSIVRDLCTVFSNVFEDNCLLFVNTEEEFERIYTTGPASCMSHPPSHYASHVHPVRVYAAGDLALAYMQRDGRIVARALCWPEKKVYSTVYGDGGRIKPLLIKAGYKEGVPFGAKLSRVITWEDKKRKTGNMALVVPHIDGCSGVKDCGDHLLIGGNGLKLPGTSVKLVGAQGISEWIAASCRKCGGAGTASSMVQVFADREGNRLAWCAGCVKEHTFVCAGTGYTVASDMAVEMHDGSKWWKPHFDQQGFTCKMTGKNFSRLALVQVRDDKGKLMPVSKAWAQSNSAACRTCGERVVNPGCSDSCRRRREKMSRDDLYKSMTTTTSTISWDTLKRG